jgi:hypothetical protein
MQGHTARESLVGKEIPDLVCGKSKLLFFEKLNILLKISQGGKMSYLPILF